MSTLQIRLTDLVTRTATECKAIRTLLNGNTADLSALTTTSKTSLVSAINELQAALAGAGAINDASFATDETWSASKITAAIAAAKSELVNGAGATLDTLNELATALGNDSNFAATVTTALGNRIRYDAAQTLTTPQITQACANLGLGEPNTDLVATFNAGLV